MMTNRAAEPAQDPVVEIRFGPVDLAQVRLRTMDPGTIVDELTGKVATAPKFFQRAAVSLDLSGLDAPPDATQLRGILDAIRRAGMLPVGLVNAGPGTEALARAADMPLLTPFRPTSKAPPVAQAAAQAVVHAVPAPTPAPVEPEPESISPLIHSQAVRSGQRLYARRRDLIVMGTVGAGAELMADGCVHVYGALRGRVMAGVRGDNTAARVFCQHFNAELVSIAGVFRVFETVPPELAGQPVQAWLDGDNLRFARIGD